MGKKITGFSLDEGVEQEIKELADSESRSVSSYVNIILLDHLKKKGITIKPKVPAKKLNRRKT
ncbi:MAG: hypothetical protein AM326_01590 [Candidatus Thorarchaeota archaeon SMTZ-45]|nr:MAG: hypothetical protein AM326_01590 [Candidatus Thorarchaeota archaeon SMTZ-45]